MRSYLSKVENWKHFPAYANFALKSNHSIYCTRNKICPLKAPTSSTISSNSRRNMFLIIWAPEPCIQIMEETGTHIKDFQDEKSLQKQFYWTLSLYPEFFIFRNPFFGFATTEPAPSLPLPESPEPCVSWKVRESIRTVCRELSRGRGLKKEAGRIVGKWLQVKKFGRRSEGEKWFMKWDQSERLATIAPLLNLLLSHNGSFDSVT